MQQSQYKFDVKDNDYLLHKPNFIWTRTCLRQFLSEIFVH